MNQSSTDYYQSALAATQVELIVIRNDSTVVLAGDQVVPTAVTQVESPAAAQVESPAVTQVESPAVAQVEPPAVAQVEPPAVAQVEPPAAGQVEPPAARQAESFAGGQSTPIIIHDDEPQVVRQKNERKRTVSQAGIDTECDDSTADTADFGSNSITILPRGTKINQIHPDRLCYEWGVEKLVYSVDTLLELPISRMAGAATGFITLENFGADPVTLVSMCRDGVGNIIVGSIVTLGPKEEQGFDFHTYKWYVGISCPHGMKVVVSEFSREFGGKGDGLGMAKDTPQVANVVRNVFNRLSDFFY